ESGHQPLLPQPPYAETGSRKVAALDDLIGVGRIAPKLVGKVEHIGEEIRNVDERRMLAQQSAGTVLALRHSVVPMLNAPTLAVERVLIIRHVAGCVDVRLTGLQVFVYQHAVVYLESAVRQRFGHGEYPNARHNQI